MRFARISTIEEVQDIGFSFTGIEMYFEESTEEICTIFAELIVFVNGEKCEVSTIIIYFKKHSSKMASSIYGHVTWFCCGFPYKEESRGYYLFTFFC